MDAVEISVRDIGALLVWISWVITIFALLTALILFLRERKKRVEFTMVKEEDVKTILSLMKEKEELMREKEALKSEILSALNTLNQKEDRDQDLLMEMVKRYEERESQRREDLMNWLEFKAKRWQDQLEISLTNRLSSIHSEISKLQERLVRLERALNTLELEKGVPSPDVELA